MSEIAKGPRPADTGAAQETLWFQERTAGRRTRQGKGERPAEAERRKLRALATVSARHAGDVLRAQILMLRLLLSRGDGATVTIDEVRAQLGELPDPRPMWLGGVPHGLRAAGLIERAGLISRPADFDWATGQSRRGPDLARRAERAGGQPGR